jgi:nucleoside-diphosphate-sugar epimerase
MIYLVTGGSGFLGKAIVEELIIDGNGNHEIRVLDIRPGQNWKQNEHIQFIQGDIRDQAIVNAACAGVDVVIHAAGIVDWGTKSREEVLDINLGGTANIIKACLQYQVPYLVYTSSLDSIFSGKAMVNIDESIDYPENHVNAYCESKHRAEILVKDANGEALKTCIMRPSDIYGEGDPYHIDSLIDMAKTGFYVRLGNGQSKCQHVYVRNMAYAHVLAAKALIDNHPNVAGSAYFITDGPGTNFFTFFDQVVIGAGYTIWPKNLWLPRWLAYSIGSLTELFAFLISPVKRINPKFSRFAVIYTCSDFTFTAEKAKRDFNYFPKYNEAEAMARTIAYYKDART